MITAKVHCTSKLITGSGEHQTTTVGFQPDYAEGRNKEWAAATPTLDLRIGLRGDLADRFDLDKSYTLTFSDEED
ncbi:MAG TPA: hypothetical protein VGP26_24500 [Actinophytocola sp.]|jgi:hypothetical protein|nr:hypothetical protein [Actinophytocola sp.]